jgi:hypothetical protein
MAQKLFRNLGFRDWNDDVQRAEYNKAVRLALSAVELAGLDFKIPWREQVQRSQAVEAFLKSLSAYFQFTASLMSSSYNISTEQCEEYLRFKCRNRVKYENSKKKGRLSNLRSRRSRKMSPMSDCTTDSSCNISKQHSYSISESTADATNNLETRYNDSETQYYGILSELEELFSYSPGFIDFETEVILSLLGLIYSWKFRALNHHLLRLQTTILWPPIASLHWSQQSLGRRIHQIIGTDG